MVDKKILWNDAGRGGLVLGGVSIAYFVISALMGTAEPAGVVASVLANLFLILLWTAKFIFCILLMRLLMKKFASRNSDADNSDTFKFGVAVALLSALLYSAFYFAWSMYIQPDMYSAVIDSLRANPMMDSNTMEQFDNMLPKLPTIGFFANFFWCFLFGTILSSILSRRIPSQNPFENE